MDQREAKQNSVSANVAGPSELAISLLTGGSDKPYVHGLAQALGSAGLRLDVIGSDELDEPSLRNMPGVNFLNLRGDQRPNVGATSKISRILAYYFRLIRYAANAKPRIFHILWNNKFETFDRTILMLYYKLLGKKIVFTAHNVNALRRDSKDTFLNRITLRIQYHLADHIFVHTDKMKDELISEFGVSNSRVSVIPFGINSSLPNTTLSSTEAKKRLGVTESQKTILFFGRIKPYKGLEYLIGAFRQLVPRHDDYRLIIAGKLEEGCEKYWESIEKQTQEYVEAKRVISRITFVPDSEAEVYFKGADVLVLPYKEIFQSGVIFLAYNFGLPVIAADVGSLKEDILEGTTGFVFKPEDPIGLAQAIERFFSSDLFAHLEKRRTGIRKFAKERHSWEMVATTTVGVYSRLLQEEAGNSRDASSVPISH